MHWWGAGSPRAAPAARRRPGRSSSWKRTAPTPARDGCNRTRGPWSAGPDGALDAGPGPSTRMACPDMVAVPSWFTLASQVRFDGTELVLLDASGAELGRVVRDG